MFINPRIFWFDWQSAASKHDLTCLCPTFPTFSLLLLCSVVVVHPSRICSLLACHAGTDYALVCHSDKSADDSEPHPNWSPPLTHLDIASIFQIRIACDVFQCLRQWSQGTKVTLLIQYTFYIYFWAFIQFVIQNIPVTFDFLCTYFRFITEFDSTGKKMYFLKSFPQWPFCSNGRWGSAPLPMSLPLKTFWNVLDGNHHW